MINSTPQRSACRFRFFLFSFLFLFSCSTLNVKDAEQGSSVESSKTNIRQQKHRFSSLRTHRRPGRLGPQGGKRVYEEKADYPGLELISHPEVDRFVEYYTTTSRSFINDSLERRAMYLPIIEPIFERYGIPKELANIALVESRFIPTAKSRDRSTVGLWQLSRVVAKNYGLKIGGKVDERMDVAKSSEVAARFLASLYDSFGDWYLVAAAWNSGPTLVQKAVDDLQREKKIDSLDLFDLTSRGLVCQITREFVAKLAALAIITDDLPKYGFVEPAQTERG